MEYNREDNDNIDYENKVDTVYLIDIKYQYFSEGLLYEIIKASSLLSLKFFLSWWKPFLIKEIFRKFSSKFSIFAKYRHFKFAKF